MRLFFMLGAIAAGLAVTLGAFGAHGLEARVTPDRLDTFKTGVLYHIFHALALFAVGVALSQWPGSSAVQWAGYLFIAGIVLFSGSLYLLVLTDTPRLGIITPFGGVAFIVGWVLLAWGVFRGG